MGSLVKDTGYSDMNATIEVFDRYGVTPDGFKRVRTSTSPAVLKQITRFIETGTVSRETALSAFPTISRIIGKPSIRDMEYEWTCRENKYIDHLGIGDLQKILPALPPETCDFVLIELSDFARFKARPTLNQITNPDWLKSWSDENLVGFHLELCREDSAPYFIKTNSTLLIATVPISWGGSQIIFRIGRCHNGVTRLTPESIPKQEEMINSVKHIVFQVGGKGSLR